MNYTAVLNHPFALIAVVSLVIFLLQMWQTPATSAANHARLAAIAALAHARGWTWSPGMNVRDRPPGFEQHGLTRWVMHGEDAGVYWLADCLRTMQDQSRSTWRTGVRARLPRPSTFAVKLTSAVAPTGILGAARSSEIFRRQFVENVQRMMTADAGVTADEYVSLMLLENRRRIHLPPPLATRGFTAAAIHDPTAFLAAAAPGAAAYHDRTHSANPQNAIEISILGEWLEVSVGGIVEEAVGIEALITFGLATIGAAVTTVA